MTPDPITAPIVGIDLGTSNTVVAYAAETGGVTTLADESGAKIHPSVVSFHPNGGVVVGASAKQRKVIDPRNTIYSIKRLIGRSFASPEVQTAKKRVPYVIKEGPNQQPIVPQKGPLWFRKMDRNGDGDVSRSEFLGTKAEFDAIDADKDGLISLAEAEAYDASMRGKPEGEPKK